MYGTRYVPLDPMQMDIDPIYSFNCVLYERQVDVFSASSIHSSGPQNHKACTIYSSRKTNQNQHGMRGRSMSGNNWAIQSTDVRYYP